jgi:hypothetical protein
MQFSLSFLGANFSWWKFAPCQLQARKSSQFAQLSVFLYLRTKFNPLGHHEYLAADPIHEDLTDVRVNFLMYQTRNTFGESCILLLSSTLPEIGSLVSF